MCVRTNVDINDKLLKEVMERLGAKTKKEAIDMALQRNFTSRKGKGSCQE